MFFYGNPVMYGGSVLIAAAVIPAIVLLIMVYRLDRLEREPWGLLLSLVLRGVASTVIAMVLEQVGGYILDNVLIMKQSTYNFLMCFLVVGCSEEGAKYFLLKRRTWYSPSFDCQFDGVVYAVFVSLGFALWENISYVFMYGFGTALARAVTAVPGHACFGVFMGAWYGAARRYENMGQSEKSRRARRMAFIVPVLLHGTYDYIATNNSGALTWGFVIFVIALFIASTVNIRRLSREDRYIISPRWF